MVKKTLGSPTAYAPKNEKKSISGSLYLVYEQKSLPAYTGDPHSYIFPISGTIEIASDEDIENYSAEEGVRGTIAGRFKASYVNAGNALEDGSLPVST
jgi:hypothetical protein